jgi:hypothetical protein
MRFLVLCLFACVGAAVEAQTTEAPPDLLDAGHCLVMADGDWFGLAADKPYSLELGSVATNKSDSGVDSLYLIDYTTPTHSQGFAFVFATRGKGSHRELLLEYRTSFQQTVDGTGRVNVADPPLGSLGARDGILAAIRKIGFHTWKVPVADLENRSKSASCKTSDAVR